MKIEANSIEETFKDSGNKENDLRKLDKIIIETSPQLKRQFFAGKSITMIGYGEMSWKTKFIEFNPLSEDSGY